MPSKQFLYILPFFLLLSLFSQVQAQALLIQDFRLITEGADVLLEWEMQTESEVTEFRVFRRFNQDQTKAHVTTVLPNGSNKYSYLDDDIFKTEGRVIHYELHVIVNETTHKFTRSLSHNPTSIQRTWGSIKSMFR
ncbi:MAG: hypothetical protein AAF587_08220 [Bacteroidota bacterium]